MHLWALQWQKTWMTMEKKLKGVIGELFPCGKKANTTQSSQDKNTQRDGHIIVKAFKN